MRLLIYGAGVIGCFYATLFSKSGNEVSLYARGKRLEAFKENGLLYETNGKTFKANEKKF